MAKDGTNILVSHTRREGQDTHQCVQGLDRQPGKRRAIAREDAFSCGARVEGGGGSIDPLEGNAVWGGAHTAVHACAACPYQKVDMRFCELLT